MPVPEDRLFKTDRLNVWFAISSVVMTASIVWMIWVDYDRPWRAFQDNYSVGKAALAHLDYLDAVRQERMEEIEQAQQRLTDAREYLARAHGSERQALYEELAEAELQFKKTEAPWSRTAQVLEVTRDAYERTLGRYGLEHPLTHKAHQQLRSEEQDEERQRQEKEHWEDEKDKLQLQLKELNKPIRTAEKTLDDLQRGAGAARRKDEQFRGVLADGGFFGIPIISLIMNKVPLGDFTAPVTTPARHQVRQLVLPDVRQRLNYLDSYTTDRCMTCHVAINDPEFSKDRLARQLERSLPGINEALQRMGEDPRDPPAPPVAQSTGEPLPIGRVTEHWEELTSDQQDVYFAELLDRVNSYLALGGRRTIELDQPLLAHPNLDLYLSVDSPHPMAKFGCTVCHEGNPQETDFVQAAHSPPTHEIEKEWEEDYYINIWGVPNVTFETISHYWDRPMHVPEHTEAGCAKCHTQITDIARFMGERQGNSINLGRHLFANLGCVNCHKVDQLAGARRVGPDLTYMASKLTPGFVQPWIYSPRKFRPSTLMPHFFMQENNRAQSVNQFDTDPVVRTETETAAMSKYLFSVSRPWQPLQKPAGVTGDVERGRELFRSVGCLACHANLAEFGEEWITEDLVQREGFDPETARHRYKGMTYEERTRYALENFVNERDTFLHPERTGFGADGAYTPPTFSRFAPELSGIGSKVTFDWLYSWLVDPTHYSSETRMPSMRLRPSEAADIAAYLMTLQNDDFLQGEFDLSPRSPEIAVEDSTVHYDDLVFMLLNSQRSERRSRAIMQDAGGELTEMLVALLRSSLGPQEAYDLISPMSLEDKKLMYLGNKMISHYGCYACHSIPGFETATPPGTDLSNWGEKPVSQLDFAFYDPALHDMRQEKQDVYSYVYPRDAEELNHLSPIDDLALEQVTHTHAAFAKHKMVNPRIWDRGKLKRPYDKLKMPNYYFTEDEADALATFLLSRVPPRVHDNLKVDYSGGEQGPIARGRVLARELNCVACHQIEDNVPTVQQYFRREAGGAVVFDEVNAPPSLIGEGAKVQHHWLHRFLTNVEPLRPWLQIRMPSFNLTGEEATALVEYFAALSRNDAREIAATLSPIHEYMSQERAAASEVVAGEAGIDPGGDWYEKESLEAETDVLRRFALERKLMRPFELDPLTASPERLRKAHARLLARAGAIADLYAVDYPFVEPPRPLSPKGRFELGSRFFDAMGCLKCHVLGRMLPPPASNTDDFVQTYRLDNVRGEGEEAVAILNGEPYKVGSVIDGHTLVRAFNTYYDSGDVETKAIVEGPNTAGQREQIMLQAPSAPNLSLTHQRLRREWVYQWMLMPGLMQPGTKMPQNFPDGQSPMAGDENFPGTGGDHVDLLVDYLFDAGATNTRAPLLKVIAVDTSDEFGEDDEFDEDEEFDD